MFDSIFKITEILQEMKNINNTLISINITLDNTNDKLERIANSFESIANDEKPSFEKHQNVKTKNEKRNQNIVDRI